VLVIAPSLLSIVIATLDASRLLQDGLSGGAAGAIVAKAIVHLKELVGGEWEPQRVRQVEFAWILALCGIGTLLGLVLR